MPCEVVACIVVLPMPVVPLLVFLCLFEVDIYILGFGAFLAEFKEIFAEFTEIFAEFKEFIEFFHGFVLTSRSA